MDKPASFHDIKFSLNTRKKSRLIRKSYQTNGEGITSPIAAGFYQKMSICQRHLSCQEGLKMPKRHGFGEDTAHNLVSQGITYWLEGQRVEKPRWLVSRVHRAGASRGAPTSPAQEWPAWLGRAGCQPPRPAQARWPPRQQAQLARAPESTKPPDKPAGIPVIRTERVQPVLQQPHNRERSPQRQALLLGSRGGGLVAQPSAPSSS